MTPPPLLLSIHCSLPDRMCPAYETSRPSRAPNRNSRLPLVNGGTPTTWNHCTFISIYGPSEERPYLIINPLFLSASAPIKLEPNRQFRRLNFKRSIPSERNTFACTIASLVYTRKTTGHRKVGVFGKFLGQLLERF